MSMVSSTQVTASTVCQSGPSSVTFFVVHRVKIEVGCVDKLVRAFARMRLQCKHKEISENAILGCTTEVAEAISLFRVWMRRNLVFTGRRLNANKCARISKSTQSCMFGRPSSRLTPPSLSTNSATPQWARLASVAECLRSSATRSCTPPCGSGTYAVMLMRLCRQCRSAISSAWRARSTGCLLHGRSKVGS